MINKDKIVLNTKTYFTCTYTGAVGVKILKVFEDDHVLVENGNGKFVRPLEFVYNEYEHARRGGRDWEHYERKRKKAQKKQKKSQKDSHSKGKTTS